ncbi:MAG: protein kinase [Planctomycetota bacterium]
MDICPHCGAAGAYKDSTDGRCPVCAMALPGAEEDLERALAEEADESSASLETYGADELVDDQGDGTLKPSAMPVADAASTVVEDGDGDAQGGGSAGTPARPQGRDLIQPRKLAPAFARRVAAGWKPTGGEEKVPTDTIKYEPRSSSRGSGSGRGSDSGVPGGSDQGSGGQSGVGELGDLRIGARDVGDLGDDGPLDYEIIEEIGRGNMGVVYSARQASLNRDVALKMPAEGLRGSHSGRKQFIAEVVVTGQLDHPNIVPIYDLARDASGQLFYSMKRVEGRSWDKLLEEQQLTKSQAMPEDEARVLHDNLTILMKACDAIRFAHDRGVIHRDIKPHNIMVGSYGEVSVMDWGIALRMDIDGIGGGVTRLSPAGTPAYMAPEMALGNAGEIGPATDVYLLGAVLYEMITGKPPHPEPVESTTKEQWVNSALLIAAQNQIVEIEDPDELGEIAYRAMATDLEHRYDNVAEFQDAIRSYLSHAESIKLTQRGEKLLAKAQKNGRAGGEQRGRFDEYDRARFALLEAVDIWPGNKTAHRLLDDTVLDYANYAYKEGAYARGIDLLTEKNPKHKPLLRKLRAARRRTNRLTTLLYSAVGLIFLGTIGFSFFLNQARERALDAEAVAVANAKEAEDQRKEAVKQQGIAQANETEAKRQAGIALANETEAKRQAGIALANETEAKRQAGIALANETEAKRQAGIALANETEAKRQAQIAAAQQRLAESASYAFEVGLAAEDLERNAFDQVEQTLKTQAESDVKSKLRGWEWGYLNSLVNQEGNRTLGDRGPLLAGRVESVAVAFDEQTGRRWAAAGSASGDVFLWEIGGDADPVRLRYGEAVGAVAFSADGKTVFAGGRQGGETHSVKAWSLPARDGSKPVEVAKHARPILSLDTSANPPRLVSSDTRGLVLLTDLGARSAPRQVQAAKLENSIWSARFSPDGEWIVTAGEDGLVQVWSTGDIVDGERDPKAARRIKGHDGPAYAAAFSPDGRLIVSGGRDRRVLATAFDPSKPGGGQKEPVKAVTDRLKTGAKPDAQAADYEVIGEHNSAVRAVAFDATGDALYTGGHDHTVKVWDLAGGVVAGQKATTLRGHGGWVRSLAVPPAGGEVAGGAYDVISGGYDRRVRVWDVDEYSFATILSENSDRTLGSRELTAGDASPDGKWVATGSSGGEVVFWDLTDASQPTRQPMVEGHDWQATTGVYFAGGKRLLTAGGDNTALVWDEATGAELLRLGGWHKTVGSGWRGVATASSQGRWIATGADGDVLARVWDAASGALITSIDTPRALRRGEGEEPQATAIAFSPSDRTLAVADQWGAVYLIDPSEGWRASNFAAHTSKVTAIKFLPTGAGLLTASTDGDVSHWDLDQRRPGSDEPLKVSAFRHADRVVAMDLSADGETFVTAAGPADVRATLRVWRRADPSRPVRTLPASAISAAAGSARELVRSVSVHATDPTALVSLFNRDSSTYRLARWSWGGQEAGFRPVPGGALRDVSTAVFAPHRPGSILTVGGRGARRQQVSANATVVTASYRPQGAICCVAFAPTSDLMVSSGVDGTLKVWRLDDQTGQWRSAGQARDKDGHSGAINSVAFAPESSKEKNVFVTASDDGTAKLWTLRDGEWVVDRTMTPPGGPAEVRHAIFLPADEGVLKIATAGDAGVFVREGGGPARRVGEDRPASALGASTDGKWLVVARGNSATVCDAATLEVASPRLTGHSGEITDIAFTPDGNRFFTTSRDATVKLWNTQSVVAAAAAGAEAGERERELLTLDSHSREVTSIAIAEIDGNPFLVTTGLDGQAILWPSEMPAK